jgi:signal peptidase I
MGEDTIKDMGSDEIYERFYFSIANSIGNNYYDPLLIPVLKDTASDRSWYWSTKKKDENKLVFWYKPYTHPKDNSKNEIATSNQTLSITSAFPSRYIFIKASFGGLFLLLLLAGLVFGLYRLIRYISYRLFLIKFIRGTATDDVVQQNKATTLFKEFKLYRESIGQPVILTEGDVVKLKDEYAYYKLLTHSTDEYQLEKSMFAALENYKHLYDFIWNKFSPKEKYLLLNYSQNSFVNYKNTEVIYHLLDAGILTIKDEEIKIFSASFRAYILKHKNSEEIVALKTELRQESAWQTFRIPFLLVILGTAAFILLTQEQAFQRITALLTGVTTAFTLLMKFFSDGSSLFSSKK